jgi:hypothetical protein
MSGSVESPGDLTDQALGGRPPSLIDALLPIIVLIGLLALTITLFGIDATNGPLQVALLLSAAFASLMAFKNGFSVAGVANAAVGGVTSAVGAIFILLAVGALIGTWNMAGTIPTIVDYGIRLVSPTWFYLATAVVCALVGMVTGSSWTTAGTLGVAFVGMSNVMGLNEAAAAGAVICGAYFGDKMTPLSERDAHGRLRRGDRRGWRTERPHHGPGKGRRRRQRHTGGDGAAPGLSGSGIRPPRGPVGGRHRLPAVRHRPAARRTCRRSADAARRRHERLPGRRGV